jgi:hypothetical protein
MNRSNYYGIFARYPQTRLSGLGIIPNQAPRIYENPDTSPIGSPKLPPGSTEVLDYVRKAGFTDILITPTGPVLTGPAEVIYRYSPRAVIEGELNPFMNYLSREQVIQFWQYIYSILKPDLKIKSIRGLISKDVRVIPDPGVPATEFFSLSLMRLFKGGAKPPSLDKCMSVAKEKYSDVKGPVAIVSPAGERLFVVHSAQSQDLMPIAKCRGLPWPSFAINQGIHDWESMVTFYLDARIMQRNLGFKGRVPDRQKAVHFAAWDNWTMRISDYDEFIELFENGLTDGGGGEGFLTAEYLAVGLDTTKFEGADVNGSFTNIDLKGSVHPLHTWDQVDDSALNLSRSRRRQPIITRYAEATFEDFPDSGYIEMKVTDHIPLSDIPMCVVHDSTGADVKTGTVKMTAQEAIDILRSGGFRGIILIASYPQLADKFKTVDHVVEQYVSRNKSIVYMPQDKTSGTFIYKPEPVRAPNFVELKGGLLMSDIEVTRGLYKLITGKSTTREFNYDSNYPVVEVTWYDAIEFCNLFTEHMNRTYGYNLTPAYTIIPGKPVSWDKTADGFRLPTEDEWEFAAKAGKEDFLTEESIKNESWVLSDYASILHKVAQKDPNDYMLFDMIGNVWEWVWSSAKGGLSIALGGSFNTTISGLNLDIKDLKERDKRFEDVGFRICRKVKKEKKGE